MATAKVKPTISPIPRQQRRKSRIIRTDKIAVVGYDYDTHGFGVGVRVKPSAPKKKRGE